MSNYDGPDSSSLKPPRGDVAVHLTEPSRMGADGKNREHIIDLMRQSRVRWLKNTEVCDILYNHRAYDFVLSPTAPVRPQGARDNRQISCLKRLRRAVGRIPLAGRGEARACVAPRTRRASRPTRTPNVSASHPARRVRPPHPARLPAPPPHRFAALLLVCHADHPAPPAGRIIVFLPPLPSAQPARSTSSTERLSASSARTATTGRKERR